MAFTQVNSWSNTGNTNVDNIGLCDENNRVGYHEVSISNMIDTSEPIIAEGSLIEVNGALLRADVAMTPSGSVTDGRVYIYISSSTLIATRSNTAPTWSTLKQGWYSADGDSRCLEFIISLASSIYTKGYMVNRKSQANAPITQDGLNCLLSTFTSVKILTGNTSASSSTTTINYPTGFTVDNTIILSIMAYSTIASLWFTIGEHSGDVNYLKGGLSATNIQLYCGDRLWPSKPYRVVIAKIA